MPKHLPLRHVILGPGEPDKKTQGLIDFSKRIPESFGGAAKQLKLSLPDSAAVTPALCKDFMDKAGCTSADTPASAKEKMQNCRHAEFDSAMKDIYQFDSAMKGIYQFHYGDAKNYSDILSLRSGDLGATGVHSSVFAGIFTNLPDSQSLNAIKGASIGVLASSFSDDAKAMAGVFSRLGGNGIGILANKFIGNDVKFGEVEGISHISPSFTLSYLAPLSKFDYELVQIFRGIASSPANASNYAAFKLKSSEDLGERFIYVHHLLASGLHDEGGSLKIVSNSSQTPRFFHTISAWQARAAHWLPH
ncbi:MAG: hypothetical protein NT051_01485 [Candidatus Micrarchaeota archaeon]|nr:hypothetical protein [Candidatus Micrarchaeota archaeon]